MTDDVAVEQARNEQDRLCEQFPAVSIENHLVHVYDNGYEWHVWLNTEDMEFTGLCVGVGITRDLAVKQAAKSLVAIVAHLQNLR